MSALLPEGIRSLADAPYVLHDAIRVALHFLRFEELPDDERPPRTIWFDEEAMTAHVEKVKRLRKQKYGGDDGDKAIDGPAEDNAAAEGLIVG